jgi:hypothetical protein
MTPIDYKIWEKGTIHLKEVPCGSQFMVSLETAHFPRILYKTVEFGEVCLAVIVKDDKPQWYTAPLTIPLTDLVHIRK